MNENELSYALLWQAYQKEKQSNELQLIPKSFYSDMLSYIESMPGDNHNDDAQAQKENAIRLLNGIFERRKQKILIYSAFGRALPSPSTEQEIEFHEKIMTLVRANTIDKMPAGESKVQALKSTQSIPEILLPSGRKIGPLEKEQIVEIKSAEDRSFLLNNGICRPV